MLTLGKPFAPMEPKLTEKLIDDDTYIYQVKWDGVRCLAHILKDKVVLFNRRLRPRTMQYPELQQLHNFLHGQNAIIDGEIIAWQDGLPNFPLVLNRDLASGSQVISVLRKSLPVNYMVFDLLYLDNQDLTHRALYERQELLKERLQENKTFKLVENFSSGTALFEAVKSKNMEGIVAKKATSNYLPGQKASSWLKIKNWQLITALIGGYGTSEKKLSLLLGINQVEGFQYIGRVGNGLGRQGMEELRAALAPLRQQHSPFFNSPVNKGVVWVQPKIAVHVKFLEWTADLKLRSPIINEVDLEL